MQRRVGFEGKPTAVTALNVDKQLFIFGAEAVEELGINDDFDLVDGLDVPAHHTVQG